MTNQPNALTQIEAMIRFCKLIDGDMPRSAKETRFNAVDGEAGRYTVVMDHNVPLRRVAALFGPYVVGMVYDSIEWEVTVLLDMKD